MADDLNTKESNGTMCIAGILRLIILNWTNPYSYTKTLTLIPTHNPNPNLLNRGCAIRRIMGSRPTGEFSLYLNSLCIDISDHFFWSAYRVNQTGFHSLSSEFALSWS